MLMNGKSCLIPIFMKILFLLTVKITITSNDITFVIFIVYFIEKSLISVIHQKAYKKRLFSNLKNARKYKGHLKSVVLRVNVPVNNFSVISGRSHRFLGK